MTTSRITLNPVRQDSSSPLPRDALSCRQRESRILEIGGGLIRESLASTPRIFDAQRRLQHLFEWAMRDPWLQRQLFRFVDVLPSLGSNEDVAEHLRHYLLAGGGDLPPALRIAAGLASEHSPVHRLAGRLTRRNVAWVASRFVAGETTDQALAVLTRLRRRRMGFTLSVVGEETLSFAQADEYAQRNRKMIENLTHTAESWHEVSQIDIGGEGESLPRVNLSIKLSSLALPFDPIAPEASLESAASRLRPLLRLARRDQAFITVDMEHHEHKDLILAIFKTVLGENEFRDFTGVGIVIQAYLRDAEQDLQDLAIWARERGHPVTVRLVKGAYWDYEVVKAAARNWPLPVFEQKWQSDAQFERLTQYLLESREWLRPAIATHNARSIAAAISHAENLGLSKTDYEFQMLFGMADPLKETLVRRGHRVRIYVPCGPLLPAMGYLIRRLLENTSNQSFLRLSFREHEPPDRLLANPVEAQPQIRPIPSTQASHSDEEETKKMTEPFHNEPPADFSLEASRKSMKQALDFFLRNGAGRSYPMVIAGERVENGEWIESRDPSNHRFLVGRAARASVHNADAAVAAAKTGWPAWAATPIEERCRIIRRAVAILRKNRFEIAALAVIEAGKPWREADADVIEAIDFCEFYAGESLRLFSLPRARRLPGEENLLIYEPRGVAVVIPPWNFPLAILTGMTVAALVTGNTVVMKPAEQTPVIAGRLFEILMEAGIPPTVLHYLPGHGEDAGARLVSHSDTATIAFTGSCAVGVRILEAASRVNQGQRQIKRIIAEMGGKNAIIVDEDADLDEAVSGVASSAFSYSGQKCSACSRVITTGAVHDAFLLRLVERTRSLRVGSAHFPETDIGPVIDAEARDKIRSYIERGMHEGRLVWQVEHEDPSGYFVGPVIFDDVPARSVLAQEEIFGPVLAVLRARDFDEALSMANDTPYALTGGIYSRHPAHLDRARSEFRAGNLYLNRPITGAVVDRQPFGGFQLSGVGAKAGGPDYLKQFCDSKTICENMMRHGFAPG